MTPSFKQLLLVFFLILCCSLNPQDSTKENALGGRFMRHNRIFGPEDPEFLIKRGQYPFLVMIQIVVNVRKERICTGSLVTPKAIVTGSICLQEYGTCNATIAFWAGNCRYVDKEDFLPPTQGREIESFAASPDLFGNSTVAYAIVTQAFNISDYVKPVGLYLKQTRLHAEWKDDCRVLGFGTASPVTDDSRIGRVMEQHIRTRIACYDIIPTEALMCAGRDSYYKTICSGDDGGPVLCNAEPGKLQQYGIVHGRLPFKDMRMVDLDCLLPQLENRYMFIGFFKYFLEKIPDLPKEDIYFDPPEIPRKRTEKKSDAQRLTVSVPMLHAAIALSALAVATSTRC